MENIDIAHKIRLARKERGLTQADIAAVISKTSATVSDIERGKIQVSAADLFKIGAALNKPIEYFFGEEYSTDAIEDLIALIRKQPPEYQEKIIQQTEMLLYFQKISEQINNDGSELSDKEISQAVNSIFAFADDIEVMYHQILEIRKSLREAFKLTENNVVDIAD